MWESASSPVERQLSSGEKLVWSGQPRAGIRLRWSDVFMIPFSILWCGFAIFWESMVVRKGAPVFMMFWGIPFVLVGLYIVFGRFIVDAMTRTKTFYGITNERIIIISGLFSQEIKSLNLRTLTDVSLSERSDGSGTITFGPVYPMGRWMPAGSWPGAGRYAPPAFDMIERAKDVYEIIRQAQKETAQGA
jgi:Bacterial PH domain